MTLPPSAAVPTCGCPGPGDPRLGRRGLLAGAALGGLTYAVGGAVVSLSTQAAAASPRGGTGARGTVVVLSLRGAADGLSLVVPHGDPVYAAARPTIAVPRTSLLATDSFFGLHPRMAPLLPLWNAGRMAAVHATGLPAPNRSHFSAMEEVEDAAPGSTARVGWLNRLVGDLHPTPTSPVRGLAVGELTTQLWGPAPAMSIDRIDDAEIAGADARSDPDGRRTRSLQRAWGASSSPLAGAFRDTLGAVGDLAPAVALGDHLAAYPDTDLGRSLESVARVLRAGVPVDVATVDQGDWDMHTNLGTLTSGRMIGNVDDLATALAAFFADLGPLGDRVTLVTLSEFGRRVVQNGGAGLDHGWGGVMLLLGAGVRGGYHATWPGLVNSLDADLTVTTDYRDVLAEVVATRTDASTAAVFPGFTPTPVGAMTSL